MATKTVILTSGTVWTVPSDLNTSFNITVTVFGGGGGGRASIANATNGTGGGGGGAGWSRSTVALTGFTPGVSSTYYRVGAAGAGGATSNASGTNGGTSWFNKSSNVAPTSSTVGALALGGSGASLSYFGGGGGAVGLGSIGATQRAGGPGGSGGPTLGSGGGGGGASAKDTATGGGGGSGRNGADGGGGGGGGVGGSGASPVGSAGGLGGLGYSGGIGGSAGNAGTNGGGGGGGTGINAAGTAGAGGGGGPGTERAITAGGTAGSGGGGGGGGGTNNASTTGGAGANGGLYGGGGGGGGGGVTTFGRGGNGGQGAIIITYEVLPPAITSVSPNFGVTAGGTSVVITGVRFTGATSVTFGGTAATSFTVNSDTQITAVSPAKTAGTYAVRVTSPNGTSADVAADNFTYYAPPTITSLSTFWLVEAGGRSVVITGTNFVGVSSVTFGGTAATSFTVDSDTQITAVSPAKPVGTVDIAVTAAGGTSPNTTADDISYVGIPTITSMSASLGPATGGQILVITGTNFSGPGVFVPTVRFAVSAGASPTASSVTVDSNTQITIITPPSNTLGPPYQTLVSRAIVSTNGGTSIDNAADNYTFVAIPSISSVSPNFGPPTGGRSVSIIGSGFIGVSSVTFGGTAATSFTVNSNSNITAISPAKEVGIYDIAVTATGGTSANVAGDNFAYRYGGNMLMVFL